RSTRSSLSTSISRIPCGAYSFSSALISEDLPVPREPVSSTLFAGRRCTNWRVLRSIARFCSSTCFRSSSRIGATCRTGCSPACTPKAVGRRRQRQAIAASQSGAGAEPNSCSKRPSSDSARSTTRASAAGSTPARGSGSVVGIDRHVVVREIAGPDRRRCASAPQHDPHVDLGLLHHPLAVLLAILRVPPAARRHVHVV